MHCEVGLATRSLTKPGHVSIVFALLVIQTRPPAELLRVLPPEKGFDVLRESPECMALRIRAIEGARFANRDVESRVVAVIELVDIVL